MSKSLRFAPAITALAMASVIAGCAAPQSGMRSAANAGGEAGTANIGVATRALIALNSADYPKAVSLAEQAVEGSPNVAGFRTLLGNAYFGSGRFASAEAAYRDSLTLDGNQPQVVLKLALVEIAQGKSAIALPFLASARDMLDPADFGLALALAGRPQDAINALEPAARQVGADARVRQNLALSYALAGDWQSARTIAAQDVPGNLIDARIQQWMTFAKPASASDQVAALTGFRPIASDPGQPTRLALGSIETRTAQAAPVAPPAVAAQPVEQAAAQPVAEAVAPPQTAAPAPEPQFAQAVATPDPQPVAAAPAPAPEPQPAAVAIAAAAAAAPDAPSAFAAMAALTHKAQPSKPARSLVRRASLPRPAGNSTTVVQLGAYGSPQRVAAAWNTAARRYSALRAYAPMSARFNSPKGLVYRLSVHGFAGPEQAKNLCVSLHRAGGSCFVRTVAGDVPVRMASR